MGFIIGAVAVVVILALIVFPGIRKQLGVLIHGFLNIFVQDIASTPEGAAAVYSQAIDELNDKYGEASDTYARFVGELQDAQSSIKRLRKELSDVESKCEALVRTGDMKNAGIYSAKREDILFEIGQKETYVSELEPRVKEAQQICNALEKKIIDLKRKSKITIENMKLDKNIKTLTDSLDELRRDTATDKLLGAIDDSSTQLRKEAVGAVAIHASKISTQMSIAEKRAAEVQSDTYLESLKAKYGKK